MIYSFLKPLRCIYFFSSVWRIPSTVFHGAGLVFINSFRLLLSWTIFLSPSILTVISVGYIFWVSRRGFSELEIYYPRPIWLLQFLMKKPLLVWWYGMVGCFSLAVSIILRCSVILVLKLQCNVGDFFPDLLYLVF